MTAVERLLKAKSLSGLIVQVLVLPWALRGNQNSLVGSATKPVGTVWFLLGNVDSLMMRILEISPTQSQHNKLFSINLSLKVTKILSFLPKRQLLHKEL